MEYLKIKKAHFIGIGGIGISAIARMMLMDSKEVSGSDREESPVTDELKKLGANISIEHDEKNVPDDVDVVIYTIAIPADNPELKKAHSLMVAIFTYPEMLGILSREKYTIAVSGTHGKTTTTAMISKILIDAKMSPTVIIGSFLKDVKSNFIAGKNVDGEKNIFVVEACEYRRSFLNLSSDILVITNIDADHLDYYEDLDDIKSAFNECVGRVKGGGLVIANLSDEHTLKALFGFTDKIIDYNSYNGDEIKLTVPGEYNIQNAKAAIAVAQVLGVSDTISLKALADFKGTWRRFEHKGKTLSGAIVYDDYAHHPTEIRASLKAIRDLFPNKKITVLFQPHLYSRTKILLKELSESFSDVDEIVLAPVYAARENPSAGVDSDILVGEIESHGKKVIYLKDFDEIEKYVRENSSEGDIIVTMGAGDIYKVGERLVTDDE